MSFNVLCACEESQAVCLAFRQRGFRAFSCDILECSGGAPQWHIKGDCLALLETPVSFITGDGCEHFVNHWDLIIAFPPCTYLTQASAVRMFPRGFLNESRYQLMLEARDFFLSLYNCNCSHVAVENPVPLTIASLPGYSQIIQPFHYGHPWRKRTCLWLRNLPCLVPTHVVEPLGLWVGSTSGRRDGSVYSRYSLNSNRDPRIRSKTFPGIASAMAAQWGDFLISEKESGFIYA